MRLSFEPWPTTSQPFAALGVARSGRTTMNRVLHAVSRGSDTRPLIPRSSGTGSASLMNMGADSVGERGPLPV